MKEDHVRIRLQNLADDNGIDLYQLRDTHKFYGTYKKTLDKMIEEE